jgi:restriction system protein
VREAVHDPDTGYHTEVEYRLAWARTYVKKYGLLDNSTRGVWSLTKKAEEVDRIEPREVVKFVTAQTRETRSQKKKDTKGPEIDEAIEDPEGAWRIKLHKLLTTELDPAAFERLIQRMLFTPSSSVQGPRSSR